MKKSQALRVQLRDRCASISYGDNASGAEGFINLLFTHESKQPLISVLAATSQFAGL